jgi:hypothetical protein
MARAGAPKGNSNAWKGGRMTKPNWSRYPYTGRPWLCDGCHLAAKCPQAREGAACAFVPEFNRLGAGDGRDPEAIAAELQELARAQKGRAMFGLLCENLMGDGLPDPDVSAELDRLAKILEVLAKLYKAQETAPSAGLRPDGLFAALFGADAINPPEVAAS